MDDPQASVRITGSLCWGTSYTSSRDAYTRLLRSNYDATIPLYHCPHRISKGRRRQESSRGGSEKSRRIRDHWTLFSRLHKQVVVEIQVITNMGRNKEEDKLYYFILLGLLYTDHVCTCSV